MKAAEEPAAGAYRGVDDTAGSTSAQKAFTIAGIFIIPITILVLIALAFAAHLPRRAKTMTVVLFALMVLQFLLPWLSGGNDLLVAIAGLHGLNAVVIVAVAGTLLGQNWAFRRSHTEPGAVA